MAKIDKLLLGAGVMKAGTTWLYAHLNMHPAIYFTPEKELHYFAELFSDEIPLTREYRYNRMLKFVNKVDINTMPLKLVLARLNWYSDFLMNVEPKRYYPKLFTRAPHSAYVADFSNLTAFISPEGWQHAKTISNECKVLLTLRHPADRLWSHMRFDAQQNRNHIDFSTLKTSALKAYGTQNHIWKNSQYSKIIESCKRNLNETELKILFFEEIHENPKKSLAEIENFLKLDAFDYPQEKIHNPVNVSKTQKRPKEFNEAFEKVIFKELEALKTLDINFPKTWWDLS